MCRTLATMEGRVHRILGTTTNLEKLRTKHGKSFKTAGSVLISAKGKGATQDASCTPEFNNRSVITEIATPVTPAAPTNSGRGIGAASLWGGGYKV